MKASRLYGPLAYAGALPFVACAILLLAGTRELPIVGAIDRVVITYSLAIVAFMAGIHWGTWQHSKESSPLPLIIWSNGLTLVMWFALLLAPPALAILIAAVCFALLLYLDQRLSALKAITQEYFQVRRNVSTVVIASLLVSAWSLF